MGVQNLQDTEGFSIKISFVQINTAKDKETRGEKGLSKGFLGVLSYPNQEFNGLVTPALKKGKFYIKIN